VYGAGGILRYFDPMDNYEEHEISFSVNGRDPELMDMRNISGELIGVMSVIKLAQSQHLDHLFILHDYSGIQHFADADWKSDNAFINKYSQFIKDARENMHIYFIRVAGHVGIPDNEFADFLAKRAVGLRDGEDYDKIANKLGVLPEGKEIEDIPWYDPELEFQY
jgi:ribonuclease HI